MEFLVFLDPPETMTVFAGMLDVFSLAVALTAGRADGKEALGTGNLTCSPAGGTRDRMGSGFGAGALAELAEDVLWNLNFCLLSGSGVGE